jgi:hypothetical protein
MYSMYSMYCTVCYLVLSYLIIEERRGELCLCRRKKARKEGSEEARKGFLMCVCVCVCVCVIIDR